MTRKQLIMRIQRVKGLKLLDPWGDLALVDGVGESFDTVHMVYEGLSVPFERGIDALVDAANGIFLTDRTFQFTKSLVVGPNLSLTFHYERFWAQSPSVPTPMSAKAPVARQRVYKNRRKR